MVTGTKRIMQLWEADLCKTARGDSSKLSLPAKEMTAMYPGGGVSSDILERRATPGSAGDLLEREHAIGLPPQILSHLNPNVFGALTILANIFQAMTVLIRKFVRGHGDATMDITESLRLSRAKSSPP